MRYYSTAIIDTIMCKNCLCSICYYVGVLFVAMCIAVSACVTSFVLREAIAHRFSKTNVRAELVSYAIDPIVRGRWDTLQHEYSCCGGYNAGTG